VRILTLVGVVGGLLGAACAGTAADGSAALGAPAFAHVQDLDGVPDLIVDGKRLADSWVVYDETFDPGLCSVVEGDVTPGDHRVLRFTVTTPNVGTADVFIGDPRHHFFDLRDGLYEFASCHNHFHFRHYATYSLISAPTGQVFRAAKRGFCMIDVTPWNADMPPKSWVYRNCGTLTLAGHQGISVGYADTYNKHLGGQYFVLDGGDGQPAVAPGEYIIRIEVNPGFVAGPGEPCPVLDPAAGLCHNFLESDYGNNTAEVRITIPDRTGKKGFGPGADNEAGTEILDDENRPDKT
jgi:hypothetical protein